MRSKRMNVTGVLVVGPGKGQLEHQPDAHGAARSFLPERCARVVWGSQRQLRGVRRSSGLRSNFSAPLRPSPGGPIRAARQRAGLGVEHELRAGLSALTEMMLTAVLSTAVMSMVVMSMAAPIRGRARGALRWGVPGPGPWCSSPRCQGDAP
jgi:hypothetical protein